MAWDQAAYMPPGGAEARSRQMATIGRIAHEKFIDPGIGKLLDDLRPYEESLPYDSDEASLIRVTRRSYLRSVNVPSALMSEITEHNAASYQIWTEARSKNDFPATIPYLKKSLDLSRRLANCYPGYNHIADPLININDEGMSTAAISALFSQLRAELVPLVNRIAGQDPVDDSFLKQYYPITPQLDFGHRIIEDFGFDFHRGRQDKTPHPFMTQFSIGDVRITTRVHDHDLGNALFSTLHEAGHGMYAQGINPNYEGTPLATGSSSGVHESQSRLWENVVGRCLRFLETLLSQAARNLPAAVGFCIVK